MVRENSAVPQNIVNISSVWPKLTARGLHFILGDPKDSNTIDVNKITGQIYLKRVLDREIDSEFRFKVSTYCCIKVLRNHTRD